jgi:hypothetical protein
MKEKSKSQYLVFFSDGSKEIYEADSNLEAYEKAKVRALDKNLIINTVVLITKA